MNLKTEITALVEAVRSVGAHVRDTGATQYGAALHQAEQVLDMADQALTPPTDPTPDMLAAGLVAIGNLPPDTPAAGVVEAIARAVLGAGQGA